MRAVTVALLAGLVAWGQVARADDGVPVVDPGGTDPLGEDPEPMAPLAPAPASGDVAAAGGPPGGSPGGPPGGQLSDTGGFIERATARTEVTFQDGLAIVDVRATFRGTTDAPAQVDERLPIPPGAVPVAVEACLGVAATDPAICRTGTLGGRPSAGGGDDPGTPRADVSVDAGGDTLRIVAWPARRGRALRVRVRVVFEAPVHAGVARLLWPTPPMAPGAARPTIRVLATGAAEPRVAGRDASHGPVPVDPGSNAEVSVVVPRLREPVATVVRARCATGPCARVRLEAPPRAPVGPVDMVILLDRSASMQGIAPERVRAAVDTLVRLLPSGSRHRLVAFAARALALPHARAAAEPAPSLGSSTRFDTAFAIAASLLQSPVARPLVVVLGDGGLTDVAASRKAFETAARRGIEVDAVSLGDDPPSPALRNGVRQTGGVVVELSAADGEPRVVERRLSAVLAPNVITDVRLRPGRGDVHLGPLRAGEELTWVGPAQAGAPIDLRALPAVATSETADPSGEAGTFVAARLQPLVSPPGRITFPARDVLSILRTRLLPGARGCLRRDRAGRPGHAVRAVFELAFADRELDGADVTGAISPALRDCLLEATDSLEVPPFPGRLLVRYPVATRAEHLEAPLPLPADLDQEIRSVGASN